MEKSMSIEYLTHFGLSRQEAHVYEQLLSGGKQTGYEIAKDTGISRSNAYIALAGLVEKGAAYLVEESAKKYVPVCPEEFCGDCIRRLTDEKNWLFSHLPQRVPEEEGYITVEGEKNIVGCIHNLLDKAEDRIYVSASAVCVEQFRFKLATMIERGKKIVVITDCPWNIKNATVYVTEDRGNQIGLIADSRYVLSGEMGEGSLNTCLYSGQKNFVRLFKNAMANEIKLIKIQKGEKYDE